MYSVNHCLILVLRLLVIHIVPFDLAASSELHDQDLNNPGNGAQDHEAIKDMEDKDIVLGHVANKANNGANQEHGIALGEHEEAIASGESSNKMRIKQKLVLRIIECFPGGQGLTFPWTNNRQKPKAVAHGAKCAGNQLRP